MRHPLPEPAAATAAPPVPVTKDCHDHRTQYRLTYQQMGTAARGQAHALFAQTMGYVAVTAGLFALGAWAGHNLAGGVGIIAFIAAFACLIGMQFAVFMPYPR